MRLEITRYDLEELIRECEDCGCLIWENEDEYVQKCKRCDPSQLKAAS